MAIEKVQPAGDKASSGARATVHPEFAQLYAEVAAAPRRLIEPPPPHLVALFAGIREALPAPSRTELPLPTRQPSYRHPVENPSFLSDLKTLADMARYRPMQPKKVEELFREVEGNKLVYSYGRTYTSFRLGEDGERIPVEVTLYQDPEVIPAIVMRPRLRRGSNTGSDFVVDGNLQKIVKDSDDTHVKHRGGDRIPL